jgi:FixJ family two-component response regulator
MAGDRSADVILSPIWSEQLPESFAISIVDDDDSVREAMGSLMRSYGYRAETFASGADFLASEARRHTDCLIADVQMPGMTGLELYGLLATSDAPIPTIMITARHDEGIRKRALASGVLCYLTKPFDEAQLIECVRAAIGQDGGASQ